MPRSGLKRNVTPSLAPGRRHDSTTTTSSSTKRVGIISFDAFSMPLRTPCEMM